MWHISDMQDHILALAFRQKCSRRISRTGLLSYRTTPKVDEAGRNHLPVDYEIPSTFRYRQLRGTVVAAARPTILDEEHLLSKLAVHHQHLSFHERRLLQDLQTSFQSFHTVFQFLTTGVQSLYNVAFNFFTICVKISSPSSPSTTSTSPVTNVASFRICKNKNMFIFCCHFFIILIFLIFISFTICIYIL